MKLLVILLALTLYGCQKCAECTTTVTQKVTGQQPVTATSTTQLCGDDLKEADGNTTTSTANVNGYTATITSVTHCR